MTLAARSRKAGRHVDVIVSFPHRLQTQDGQFARRTDCPGDQFGVPIKPVGL
jgi:hypothetical protein